MKKIEYTKDMIKDILINIYNNQSNKTLTSTFILSQKSSPTYKVYKRLFGDIENACKYSNIPYGKYEYNNTINYKYHKKENMVGKENVFNHSIAKIIEYKNANNIIIEFQDEHKFKMKTSYFNWKNKNIKNPYEKNIYNVAYKGNTHSKINGIKKESYKTWYAMIQRCYKDCYNNKKTYIDCFVCDEWLCYENFEKWFDKNYYIVNNEVMNLDKDILIKGNKIYSPKTCCFVPKRINILFVNTKNKNVIKKITDLYKNLIPNYIYDKIYKNYIL